MIKQFLKIAGVKTEKDLLRKYGSEQEFFAKHPEAEMLVHAAMGGSFYQDGGSPLYSTQGQSLRNFMNTVAYTPGGWMPGHVQLPPVGRFDDGGMAPQGGQPDPQAAMVQQGPPPPDQGQGGGQEGQLQEVIKFIVQALQQGMAPEQIIAKLTEMGVPQDQAGELVQGVVQQLQAQGGAEGGAPQQGPQEEMMEGPQGQEAPPQEMMEGQAPMGRYGGMYRAGGEPCPDPNMVQDAEGHCRCKEGYEADQMTGECYPIGEDSPDDEIGNDTKSGAPIRNTQGPSMSNRGNFNAGFGLKGKKYNFDYGFKVGSDFKTGVEHNATLGIPNLFTMGKNKGGLDLNANYKVGRSWGAGLGAGIPLTGDEKGSLLRFTGNVGQMFTDPELRNTLGVTNQPESNFSMMEPPKKNPLNYQAGVEYLGKMFGAKGPDVKISASYGNRKFGGLSKFVGGGAPEEMMAAQQAPQQGGQDQQQQLMQQVAQMLQQGAQPEQVMQQLVQMGMPQDQAQQLIQMIMQQMQGGGQGQAPMKMGGTPCYNCGGMYADGGDTEDNGTYYQGMYMAYGGPYIPLYGGGGDNNYGGGGPYPVTTQMTTLPPTYAPYMNNDSIPNMMMPPSNIRMLPSLRRVDPRSNSANTLNQLMGQQAQQHFNMLMEEALKKEKLKALNDDSSYSIDPKSGRAIFNYYNKIGGSVKKYKKGGEYEMSDSEIQDLIKQGYKIQYI